MLKRIKKAIISIMLVACATSGAVGIATVAGANDTAPVIVKDTDISMIQGASIRAVTSANGGYGIRFTGTVSKAVKEELEDHYGKDNVEYGILICPKDYLTDDATLDFDETDGLKRYNGTVESGVKYFESRSATELALNAASTAYEFRCSLVSIKTKNLDREFAAAAYVGVRTSEEEEFEYTVSSAFSRNIYTVATYALNDSSLELGEDATEYLENGVVGEVNKTYTQTKVELSSDAPAAEEKLFSVGETLTLNASVVNSDGKELETGISLANADSANLVKKFGNTYTVSSIGNIDLSVAFKGFDATNTDLSGYKCDTKCVAADTLYEAYRMESNTPERIAFEKSTSVTHPSGTAVYKYIYGYNKSITFSSSDMSMMHVGDYIVWDIYGVDSPAFALRTVKIGEKVATNSLYGASASGTIDGLVEWTTYDTDGSPAKSSMEKDDWDSKWVRIQLKLLCDPSTFSSFGFVIYNNNYHDLDKGLYVSNLQFKTYMEGYSDIRLVDFDDNKSHNYGDEIELKAQAKSARGVWEDVSANYSLNSGSGTVEDNTFNVGLGNSKVKFSFAGIEKEVTVKGATSMPVSTDKVVLLQDAKATLESADSYTDANGKTENDVLKWYAAENNAQGNAFKFTEDVLAECSQGRYIYVKVLFTKQCTFYISSKESCYVFSNSYSYKQVDSKTGEHNLGEGLFELYNANGVPCGESVLCDSDKLVNQWLTIELKFSDSSWTTKNDWRFFSWLNENFCTAESPAYIAGAEITLKPKDFSTANINVDGVTHIAKYAYTYDETQTTFSEIKSSDIEAVSKKLENSKVYAWAPAEGLTKFDGNKGGISFGISRFMKQGMYLYYDFYVTGPTTLTMFSGAKTCCMYYNGQLNGENWQLYDSNGNALTSGSIYDGNFTGQWITVEFKLVDDWGNNDAITRSTDCGKEYTFYLANIKLSSSKLLGDTENA